MFHLLLLRLTSRTDDELVLMMADARYLYEWMRKLNKMYFSKKTLLLTTWRTSIHNQSSEELPDVLCWFILFFISFKESIHVLYELLKILCEPRMLKWWRWVRQNSAAWSSSCELRVTQTEVFDVSQNRTSHWWRHSLNEKKIYWSESCSHS